MWLLSACVGRRFLKDNEQLLVDQVMTGTNKVSNEEISELFEYKPSDRVLFLPWSPYVYFYQAGLKSYDSLKYEIRIDELNDKYDAKIEKHADNAKKQQELRDRRVSKINKQNRNIKEGNFLMRMGEPLAIYDTAKERKTLENIKVYLQSKGYFDAEVQYESDVDFKMVTSIYHVIKNEPHIIDSIFYDIPDSTIKELLLRDRANSLIQKNANYDQDNLIAERERINTLLQNNGYFGFSRNRVNYLVDTSSLQGKRVIVGINIQNPKNRAGHKAYTLDSVIFVTDADIRNRPQKRSSKYYKGISYRYYEHRYSEKILNWRVFLDSDSLYRRQNTTETQKQLSNMDIFKFVSVNYDTTGGKFIANIYASPLKKYQTSSEMGLNVSNGLPGPFLTASIKNRNAFGGLEIMELGGRVGFEGISGASETQNPYSSLDYGANLSFTFPQFLSPFSETARSRFGRLNPRTRLSVGMNFNYRLEYERNTINSSMLYTWTNFAKRTTHNFAFVDANYIKSDITSESYRMFLEDLRAQGNNLINAFNSAFVNSIWYSQRRNINDYGNHFVPSALFRFRIETGGNTATIYEAAAGEQGIDIYQYARFNVDYRKLIPFNSKVALAMRINTGVAIPYSNEGTLPYEKFYFAGGSNSIRAWEPRRLGPGAYLPISESGRYSNRFEQPAELLFESGIELRHELISFLKGAIFIDAGNSWRLSEDDSRPGGKFEATNFLKELAVGAGYGIRFDLSFLILRFDVARKIIEPGRIYVVGETSEGEAITEVDDRGLFELPNFPNYNKIVFNLGVGFPF